MNSLAADLGIMERLDLRAEKQPELLLYSFEPWNGPSSHLSAASLLARVNTLAGALAEFSGQPVLLTYPDGLEFICSFLACLRAGVIAVPTNLPRHGHDRLKAIATDCQPVAVLTDSVWSARLKRRLELPIPYLATEEIDTEPEATFVSRGRHGLAFVQYTSGSTSSPRGARISHANLQHNSLLIEQALGAAEADLVGVGWLPMYHDMGLLVDVLAPLFVGFPAYLLEAQTFIRDPLRWLRCISRRRATASIAPNFAYDYCASKAEESDLCDLDLRSWRMAGVGAEPVRAETLDRFARTFAAAGFSARAFVPAYGLAENTVLVSCADPGTGARTFEHRGRTVVSCGPVRHGVTVEIRDSSGQLCPTGEEGEIYITGASLADGYWGRTDERFQNGWFRSGDLGLFQGGELAVTGRTSDLIIVRGRNLYPEDFEGIAEEVLQLQGCNACAAFAVEQNGQQRVVLVSEFPSRLLATQAQLLRRIRARVQQELETSLDDLVCIRAASLPRTSSGKVQRNRTRQAYLEGRLARIEPAPAPLELSPLQWLLGELAGAPPEPHSLLLELGLDSLKLIQLQAQLVHRLNRFVTLEYLLTNPSVQELQQQLDSAPEETPTVELSRACLPRRLSSLERLLLFDERPGYPMHVVVEARYSGKFDAPQVEQAWKQTLAAHPLTGARLAGGHWVTGKGLPRVLWLRPEEPLGPYLERPFELESEPGLRLLITGERVVLVMHHALADGLGIARFLSQLFAAYAAYGSLRLVSAGPEAPLPASGSADKGLFDNLFRFVTFRPQPLRDGRSSPGWLRLQTHLDPEATRRLREKARELKVGLPALMVTSLFQTLAGRSEMQRIRLLLPVSQKAGAEFHNRFGLIVMDRRAALRHPEQVLRWADSYLRLGVGHRGTLFSRVVGWLDKVPGLLRMATRLPFCLGTAAFSYLGDPGLGVAALGTDSVRIESVAAHSIVRPRTSLCLVALEYAGGLSLGFTFDGRAFDQEGAERLRTAFSSQLLEA